MQHKKERFQIRIQRIFTDNLYSVRSILSITTNNAQPMCNFQGLIIQRDHKIRIMGLLISTYPIPIHTFTTSGSKYCKKTISCFRKDVLEG